MKEKIQVVTNSTHATEQGYSKEKTFCGFTNRTKRTFTTPIL